MIIVEDPILSRFIPQKFNGVIDDACIQETLSLRQESLDSNLVKAFQAIVFTDWRMVNSRSCFPNEIKNSWRDPGGTLQERAVAMETFLKEHEAIYSLATRIFFPRKLELTEIHPRIFHENLTHIYVSGHKIRFLPPAMGLATNLQFFDCSDNEIDYIPPDVSNCKKLTCWILSGCKLTSICVQVRTLPKLERLALSGNPLPSGTIEELTVQMPNCRFDEGPPADAD